MASRWATEDTWAGTQGHRGQGIVATCCRCIAPGACNTVECTEPWFGGHRIALWERPDLTFDPANWQPEHMRCSDATGQAEGIRTAETCQTGRIGAAQEARLSAVGRSMPTPHRRAGERSRRWAERRGAGRSTTHLRRESAGES